MAPLLKRDQEQLIEQAMQAGLIPAAGDALDVGLEAIRRGLAQDEAGRPASAEERSRELHARVQSHSAAFR